MKAQLGCTSLLKTDQYFLAIQNKTNVTWIDCCVDAGEIKGMSNFAPSALTKEDLTIGSLSNVARQLIAEGTPRLGWEGFFSCIWHQASGPGDDYYPNL
jgi:hypothetical protein